MKLKKPIFWENLNFISILLYPLTLITEISNYFKNLQEKQKFNIKTICVGNIYLGGTGKTPLSIKINKILKKKFKVVFIKKFYSNQFDEQNLLKKNGKLITIEKRRDGLRKAVKKKFDLAILDDGLQEKKINHDITIVCFNSSSGIGNGLILPAGPLREKISSLKKYDAAFLNGEKKNKNLLNKIKKANKNINIFESKYTILNLKYLNKKKNYLVFSGIGNPSEFENTLKKYKLKINEHLIFPDHYKYSSSEINEIKYKARSKNLKIITTEKDYLRLNNKDKKNINFVKIDLKIKNLRKFCNFLNERL
tara:strand:- start:5056 stop:5979 length:924 start_codon:yes stop_codon:yes gene_type:complete